jgi:pimeloyl-ACP methyl ester carboxylesterase
MPIAAGLHYFLHEAGSILRPPLVLIHGAGGEHLSWPPEIRRLPDCNVFTVDLPGHGKTEGLGRQSIDDYARSIVDFMDAAGLSRAVFAGYSMGGAIALVLALNHPERVAGILLISTGPCLPIPASVLENGAHPSTLVYAINTFQEMSFGAEAPVELKETVLKRLTNIRHTLLLGDWMACDRFDVNGRLEEIRTPTLVICGTDDKLTPLHLSENLANHITGAALQTVDKADHMLILEQPQRIAKLINIFLSTIPYTPGM